VAAVATLKGRVRRQRRRAPPDDVEVFDPEEDPELGRLAPEDDPELGRLAPDDRVPDEPEDDRDGACADDDLPDDGAPRTVGALVYGDPDPIMFRLGRDGEVRGTMTGRDRPEVEPERPPPRRGVTGCRTRGEDKLRVLGREGAVRAVGREDELRVLGRLRLLGGSVPILDDDPPPLRLKGPAPGSTRARVLPPDPLTVLPPPLLPGR
jgi:hypothetical protein